MSQQNAPQAYRLGPHPRGAEKQRSCRDIFQNITYLVVGSTRACQQGFLVTYHSRVHTVVSLYIQADFVTSTAVVCSSKILI